METVYYQAAVGQQSGAHRPVEAPVHAVRFHGGTLFGRQQAEAIFGRCRVAAPCHGQHLRRLRVGQVGHQRHVQLVPLLEADLVEAHVLDHPRGVDLLVVLQRFPMADKGGDTTCRPPSTGKITAVATPNQGQRPGFADRHAERFQSAQVPCDATSCAKDRPENTSSGGCCIRRNMPRNPAFSGFQALTLLIFQF